MNERNGVISGKGLKSYGGTFGAAAPVVKGGYVGAQARWKEGAWTVSTWGHRWEYFDRDGAQRLLDHPAVFVDLAARQGTVGCAADDFSPFCDSQAGETAGIVELIRAASGSANSQEEQTARSFVGSQAQYVVEALIAQDAGVADPTALTAAATEIRMAKQLAKVYQIRLVGQHLYAGIKDALRAVAGDGHRLVPVRTYTEFGFDSQPVYTLPWFVFNKEADPDKPPRPAMGAIRPDVIIGYAGAIHVCELKTHTELDRRIGPEPWSLTKTKAESTGRLQKFRADFRQTLVEALAVWYRVQLNPVRPTVWAHLIDTTAYVAGKRARSEIVSIEINAAAAAAVAAALVSEMVAQPDKSGLLRIVDDAGNDLDMKAFAAALRTREYAPFAACSFAALLAKAQ